ncbi:putative 4,5-bisphosphate-binding protein [Rhypophila decipiens]
MATAKSPSGAPSLHANYERGYTGAGYFPQPQQQQQPPQNYHSSNGADVETMSNTLANLQSAHPEYVPQLAAPIATRPTKFTEEWDASQRGSSIIEAPGPGSSSSMHRSNSFSGGSVTGGVTGDGAATLSRGNTLRKKPSIRRTGSLKRSSSRRSMKAGSVRSLALQSTTDQDEANSAFHCPVPTSGNPTEVLANRFQAWRKILKDLITYFKEIQTHYEHRAKSLVKLSNVLNNTTTPAGFLASGGLDDALQILRNYNRQAVIEANKAREIEEDVILALTGLRSDLHQKIKEIKNLSGDFKNSVDKEMDATRRAVNNLQEILGQTELDSALTTGKQDPYLLRLAVDRQLERQIDEENYLHQAYLNLENSGRELESIVVGEIQKSYNAYAGILKRESDAAYNAIEELRIGPISMPKDTEWGSFVQRDDRFVDPDVPMRSAELIHYPGRDHYACQEIRAGLLERKSKYLKSYAAGWYVLSPTHLHEFKSADKTQAPVMSLYLPDQKLGSHSVEGASSNKFILKGRQTGSMHRGHTWVFRAESYDTMLAWYEDIKAMTERSPEERSNFLRGHGRSASRSSQRSSVSSDGVDDDEEPPFASTAVATNPYPKQDALQRRPSGGRFPSDLQVNAERGLQVPLSPLSVSSGYNEDAVPAPSVPPAGHSHGAESYPAQDPRSVGGVGLTQESRNGMYPLLAHPDTMATNSSVKRAGKSTNAASYGDNNNNPDVRPVRIEPAQFGYGSETGDGRGSASVVINAVPASTGPGNGWRAESDRRRPGDGEAGGQDEIMGGTVNGGAYLDGKPTRPGGGAVRNDSIPTISHLHIPGEYPRAAASGSS